MAQKLCVLLGQTDTLLLEQGIITNKVVLMRNVHASYRAFGRPLVRLQAYPGFSDNEHAYVAARDTYGDRNGELVEAELPFAPESIAEFVVERFAPAIA